MQKRRVSLFGDDIAYVLEGSGPLVVLIHGLAGSAETWQAVVPELSRHFTVLAPDLLGHGDSGRPRGDYTLGAFATSLRDLLDHLGFDRATFVGQSFGGGVAMQFSHQFPERCERLVLVGSGGLGPEVNALLGVLSVPGGGWLLVLGCQSVAAGLARRLVRWLKRRGVPTSPALREMGRSYASLADPATRRSFLQTLRSVVDVKGQRVSARAYLPLADELPTLIVWGDRDPIIPVAHARATHEIMPHSRLEIFPGVGHYPHCEAPESFVRVLTEFIRSTKPRSPAVGRAALLLAGA